MSAEWRELFKHALREAARLGIVLTLSGSNWGRSTCPSCTDRLKTGNPAALLPSGLLGPVRLLMAETAKIK